MKNSGWVMLGSIVGFSAVICLLLMSNDELKKEAKDQLGSALKTTGKLVRHYRNAVETITAKDEDESVDSHADEWNDIHEASMARAQ